MKYSLTIFKSAVDNKTHRRMDFDTWDSFRQLLFSLSDEERAGKKDAPLISPAVYQKGTTRSNRNVVEWGRWACVDVDEWEIKREEIDERLSSILGDVYYLCYSTASCRATQQKFRIVFRLTRSVQADEVKRFWYALNEHISGIGDAQTKDVSRMYYVPATYADADNWIFDSGRADLDVDWLIRKYPYVEKTGNAFLDKLPEDIRDNVLEHRKSSLDNTNVQWTSYRDCPFFPKRMAEDYRGIAGTGWYHKMYQIMVAIACNAVKAKYPITETQIAQLCRELDQETGNWYENRPLNKEAGAAINWAYANTWEE